MWEQLKRLIKPNGAIVMTASQPFTTTLIASNMKMFRYQWHWHKGYSTGFANCNKMPMKSFEDVLVFYSKLPNYNPQGLTESGKINRRGSSSESMGETGCVAGESIQKYTNYPTDEIRTSKERTQHPTGKPVALMEYLIKTYTNKGETVLDFTMGSGTTGVACKNLGRRLAHPTGRGRAFAGGTVGRVSGKGCIRIPCTVYAAIYHAGRNQDCTNI